MIRLDNVAEQKQNKKKKTRESAQSVTESKYLNEFDAIKKGPLHDQCCANCNMIQFHKSVQYLYSNVQFAKRHGQLPVNQNALAICALAVLGIHCSNSAYNEGLYQTSWANGVLGHCLNLHQHVKKLASILPRYPRDLSIILVKMKGKDNTFKDVKV